MHFLPYHLLSFFLLLSSALAATNPTTQDNDSSNNPFDCHVSVGNLTFDLTSLGGVHTVSRTRETPPTTMVDQVRFNLCEDLSTVDGAAAEDQCPEGTRACLTTTNKKGDDPDRIVAVIPIAQTSSLKPEYSITSSPKRLSLTFHGSSYPDSASIPQSLKLFISCTTENSDPTFTSYNSGQVEVDWSSPAGCRVVEGENPPPTQDDDKKEGEGPVEQVGSGLGFFFLVLLLAFVAYFALGAYYNYSTYGARGVDLIPHRDFWKEVPYMLQDVVSHLCSTVRPRRSSRGGYIAV